MNFSSSSNATKDIFATIAPSYSLKMDGLDIAYVTVTCIMSLMSILGCLVLLVVHCVYTDLRTVGRTMLVHLTVADLLTALGNLMGVTWYLNVESMLYKMAYCKFHSALTIMSSIASFLWTVVIAWFVFWIVLSRQPSSDQRQRSCTSKVLPFVCWGFQVMLIAVVALLENVLGYDKSLSQASWCWIDPEADYPLLWTLITGKAWEVAACAGTVILYMAVKVIIFKQARKQKRTLSHHNRKLEEANTKLTFVPLVFIIIRIWGTIRFLFGIFAHDYASSSDSDWIVIMQGTGDSAQGFANCVIYCLFTQKIRKRLQQQCRCPILSWSQSSTNGSGSSRRVSERRRETLGVNASSRRPPNNNKVVPVVAGISGNQQEQKDTQELQISQEQIVNNQHSLKEHQEDGQHNCQEEQPMNMSQLLQSQTIQTWPTAATNNEEYQSPDKNMHNIVNENNHKNNTKTLILSNELDIPDRGSSWTKQTEAVTDSGNVDSKDLLSLEQNKYTLWTTQVSQTYELCAVNPEF